ncbi:YadA-like family protein [Candidatus Rariloculus sp.]|uniref:YadA C-terminal domain-containing protein n=1 Tax=Candidatus Rariloculus sp. TaxID=3101265 RepID=UPI003D0CEC7F
MILKRILMTALGALGMGALAAGTAFAQEGGPGGGPGGGNVPAPDLFNDQIACSMNVPLLKGMGTLVKTPSVVPMASATNANPMSPLDMVIGMGEDLIVDDDDVGLGYVVPPGGSNCGGVDMEGVALPAISEMTNAIAADVASGYSELLDKYIDVYGPPGAATPGGSMAVVTAARKALTDAQAVPNNEGGIKVAQDALDDALETHTANVNAYNSASQGPIYQAGVDEWMAKAAVSKTINDYNKAVTKIVGDPEEVADNGSKGALDTLSYADYVPLGNDELIGDTPVTNPVTITDGMAAVNLEALRQYTNALGDMEATPGRPDPGNPGNFLVADTSESNFDKAGNLVTPQMLVDHDDDGTTPTVLRPLTVSTEIGTANGIRAKVENTNLALGALKKLQGENSNALLQPLIDEAVRRAQAEADHYNSQWAQTLADSTDKRTDDQKILTGDDAVEPFSIASRYAAYRADLNARVVAEADLRVAVANREAATANVVAQFTSPASFYAQLVARRQALKATADAAVAKASVDGGTPTKAQTDAATARAKALVEAEEAQADYQAYVGDQDGPTAALIAELLKGDGDDGGALVTAIGATYDVAKSAADDARAVVAELTGAGGAVSLNTAAIADHETRISSNTAGIAALDGRVTTNEADIEALDGRVTVNEGAIAENADAIIMNAGHIMENRGMIETNATGIMMNAGMIAEMGGAISSNTAGIATNAASITTNSNGIRTLRSGVAAAMAMAGMPEIGDRGVAVGAASYDGESAFAVGVHFSGENSRFKAGITSSGGETGISVGAGWGF